MDMIYILLIIGVTALLGWDWERPLGKRRGGNSGRGNGAITSQKAKSR